MGSKYQLQFISATVVCIVALQINAVLAARLSDLDSLPSSWRDSVSWRFKRQEVRKDCEAEMQVCDRLFNPKNEKDDPVASLEFRCMHLTQSLKCFTDWATDCIPVETVRENYKTTMAQFVEGYTLFCNDAETRADLKLPGNVACIKKAMLNETCTGSYLEKLVATNGALSQAEFCCDQVAFLQCIDDLAVNVCDDKGRAFLTKVYTTIITGVTKERGKDACASVMKNPKKCSTREGRL